VSGQHGLSDAHGEGGPVAAIFFEVWDNGKKDREETYCFAIPGSSTGRIKGIAKTCDSQRTCDEYFTKFRLGKPLFTTLRGLSVSPAVTISSSSFYFVFLSHLRV